MRIEDELDWMGSTYFLAHHLTILAQKIVLNHVAVKYSSFPDPRGA
jgi:hypothetical protein